jgi:hypothetical protein
MVDSPHVPVKGAYGVFDGACHMGVGVVTNISGSSLLTAVQRT